MICYFRNGVNSPWIALLVDFITNFDIDMMDATVAYYIVLYCNHRNERIASLWFSEQCLIRHSYHGHRFTTCTC